MYNIVCPGENLLLLALLEANRWCLACGSLNVRLQSLQVGLPLSDPMVTYIYPYHYHTTTIVRASVKHRVGYEILHIK